MGRYCVGCAGQFVLGQIREYDNEDEAIVACESPPGCSVFDALTGEWFGPTCWEEIADAKRKLRGA